MLIGVQLEKCVIEFHENIKHGFGFLIYSVRQIYIDFKEGNQFFRIALLLDFYKVQIKMNSRVRNYICETEFVLTELVQNCELCSRL